MKAEDINPALLALSFKQTAADVVANFPKVKRGEPRIENQFLTVFLEAVAAAGRSGAPHSSPGCTRTWLCLPAPERWWWSKPRRCSRKKRGKPQNRPRRRWRSPCGSLDLDPGLRKSHPPSAGGPWKTGNEQLSHTEVAARFQRITFQ